jgi:predicted O-methyltransferase YrrM
MNDISSQLITYAVQHTSAEDEVLTRLYRETHLRTVYPRMASGHFQGKLLEMISQMIRPSAILEIGTFTGYSAICLAKGLTEQGLLHTIDINYELADIAHKFFREAGLERKIILHTGDAREIIPTLSEPFDLVFIDGDKGQYPEYYVQAMLKLKMGGFLLADNVLWNGKVLPEYQGHDKETRGILAFNHAVRMDARVEKLMLPVHDGLFILRRIA